MGRPRKPTSLKLVEGSRDRRPLELQAAEPRPDGEVGEAPDHFTARQRKVWERIVHAAPWGLLKALDRYVLEQFVMAVSRIEEANERYRDGPMLIKTASGIVVENPLLRIIRQQAMLVRAFAGELGFSPASRTRIACEQPPIDDDPEGYFGGY